MKLLSNSIDTYRLAFQMLLLVQGLKKSFKYNLWLSWFLLQIVASIPKYSSSPIFPPSFIIDHSYSCEATKYALFRLCPMNISLNSLSFGSQFVTDSHKNAIYQSLLSAQQLNSVEISYPLSSFTPSASTSISLLSSFLPLPHQSFLFLIDILGLLNAHQLVSSWV